MKIRNFVKKIVGEKNLGKLDYLIKPQLSNTWGGPFNGQEFRQKIFNDIISRINFKAIVETGTFRGTTTLFFSRTRLPVYSVESNSRFYGYASLRLLKYRNICLYQGDSRFFLHDLTKRKHFRESNIFFYLDAHWEEDLPLLEELEIIFNNWDKAVVMVDDFNVPETNYGYDDYGFGKILNMDYLKPLAHLNISAFFPSVGPEKETGFKRGCVVLAKDNNVLSILRSVESLTLFKSKKLNKA